MVWFGATLLVCIAFLIITFEISVWLSVALFLLINSFMLIWALPIWREKNEE